MLEELIAIHEQVMSTQPVDIKRYLYNIVNWEAQAICFIGARGVGKTTMMCQHLMEQYQTAERALYISADNITVSALSLFKIAQHYFKYGGEALYIDEVHKYDNWAQEVKNIIDTYKNKKLVISASSATELHKSKYDLSRRIVYHKLPGLSFREYLAFKQNISIEPVKINDVFMNHTAIARQFNGIPILKYFQHYLAKGYYPFFLEDEIDYYSKLNNVIEKVIYEDLASSYNLRQPTLLALKKILWLVATADVLQPNIDRISNQLGVSREIVYNTVELLNRACLTRNLYPATTGMKLIRKPAKIYMEDTNLLAAINGDYHLIKSKGALREAYFANQLSNKHQLNTDPKVDFLIDETYRVEVGGPSKDFHQLKGLSNAYIAADEIEIGFGNKIPLYVFGLLY